jgi:hypothetical protein
LVLAPGQQVCIQFNIDISTTTIPAPNANLSSEIVLDPAPGSPTNSLGHDREGGGVIFIERGKLFTGPWALRGLIGLTAGHAQVLVVTVTDF